MLIFKRDFGLNILIDHILIKKKTECNLGLAVSKMLPVR